MRRSDAICTLHQAPASLYKQLIEKPNLGEVRHLYQESQLSELRYSAGYLLANQRSRRNKDWLALLTMTMKM